MFDLLASADLLVADAGQVTAALEAQLGILPPRGIWRQNWPGWGFDARWCRVARRVTSAPTHLEIIAPAGTADPAVNHPHLAELYQAQHARAYKTHSTPVATSDLDGLVARLDAAGVTYRLDEPVEELPFPRLWLGRSAETHGPYNPTADGGLYLEFLPTDGIGIPILTEPPEPPEPPDTGAPLVRITARTVLVDDLDASLAALDRNLGWGPAAPVAVGKDAKRARLSFTHVHSADLELVQATDPDTRVGRYFAQWGAGPYGIRLLAHDLTVAERRLRQAGVRTTAQDATVFTDPAQTFGVQFELTQEAGR